VARVMAVACSGDVRRRFATESMNSLLSTFRASLSDG
jgi:hypothetical protein